MLSYETYFTVEEVAMRLKKSKGHVYWLIKNKKLKAYNIGMGDKPRYVISETEYRRYLATITK